MPEETRPVAAPPALRPGDRVAIAAPSGPVRTPRRMDRGVRALTDLGYDVIVGPQARTDDPEERSGRARADELNVFLNDPTVRGVFAAIGGYTANATLPHLDYAALRRDPKVICGYSDVTALLLACHAQTGVVVFHGPTVLPELAEYPEAQPYTTRYWRLAAHRPEPMGVFEAPREWTDEFLPWDLGDDRPRRMRPSHGWCWLVDGEGTGPLLGGNLETISALGGTPYLPDFRGAVVFLETVSTDIDQIERSWTHLEMLGVFASAAAVLFGRPLRADERFAARLRTVLQRHLAHRGVPVVADVDLGHTDPMLTLPIGVRALVDSATRQVKILDAAVC